MSLYIVKKNNFPLIKSYETTVHRTTIKAIFQVRKIFECIFYIDQIFSINKYDGNRRTIQGLYFFFKFVRRIYGESINSHLEELPSRWMYQSVNLKRREFTHLKQ
jgi:hypothetical protein